ncbi:MAG: glycosyltransferase family 4 protein [Methylophaga sp.]|nr:glycosyltransferase family 4 protein [Methylophaga sp.]
MTFSLLTFDARHITPYGIGYAADSISGAMNHDELRCHIYSYFNELASNKDFRKPLFRNRVLYKLCQKLLDTRGIHQLACIRMLSTLALYDAAYLWTNCELALYQKIKEKNKVLISEAINTHQNSARMILDAEYARIGVTQSKRISDENITDENAKLALSDFIFCPSPNVAKSMLDNGVDAGKLIETSYGLGSHQRHQPDSSSHHASAFNLLFVGSGIIRKGIHLLLEYWRDSQIDGLLTVIGNIDPEIEQIVQPYRSDQRFQFVSFTKDIDPYFKQADVFVLPSLEEGSPLVTYLAIGAGLPCIVSPMGGDGVIRDGVEGYIIDPHDKAAWIATLENLAKDKPRVEQLSKAAYERSEYFLWQNVGQRRAEALMTRMGEKP